MTRTAVALVDANNLFRAGLKALFAESDFAVVAEASSIEIALGTLVHSDASIVLHDPQSADPEQDVSALKGALPGARVVVLTSRLTPELLSRAISGGADGILKKDISPEALEQSLRLVMTGEKVFPSELALLLANRRHDPHGDGMPGVSGRLSRREVQILRRLLNGESNKEIALRLEISEATAKVHLKSLLRKIGAANRTQAAIWAMTHDIEPERPLRTAA